MDCLGARAAELAEDGSVVRVDWRQQRHVSERIPVLHRDEVVSFLARVEAVDRLDQLPAWNGRVPQGTIDHIPRVVYNNVVELTQRVVNNARKLSIK